MDKSVYTSVHQTQAHVCADGNGQVVQYMGQKWKRERLQGTCTMISRKGG